MSRVVLAAAFLLLCGPQGVQAQAAGPTAPASDYEALVRDAVAEFGHGNFLEARAVFERAHVVRPSARTLRGLGICAYELRRYRLAISELESALQDQRYPLDDTQRGEVQEVIEKARRYVGTLHLEVLPANAELQINGLPTATREIELDAGDYVVTAAAAGHKSAEQRVSVGGGQRVTARLVLIPIESREAGPGATAQPAGDDEASGPGPWPWLVTGIAGAVTIGGGVLLVLAMNDISMVDDAEKGTPFSKLESAYDGAPIKSAVGFALLGVGAAGIAAGLIWAFGTDQEKSRVEVALRPDRIVLQGRF